MNMISERGKIINSLEAILNVTKEWFASSYPKDIDKSEWFDPQRYVFKVDFSILPNIINSNLVSRELTVQLTYFIQLITRFNQSINQFSDYVFSDIDLYRKAKDFYDGKDFENKKFVDCYNELDKLKNEIITNKEVSGERILIMEEKKKLLFYMNNCYFFKKSIHTATIGEMGHYGDDKFPHLNKCFHNIITLVICEKKNNKGFFNDDFRYMIGDLIFLLIPAIIILVLIFDFACQSKVCLL